MDKRKNPLITGLLTRQLFFDAQTYMAIPKTKENLILDDKYKGGDLLYVE